MGKAQIGRFPAALLPLLSIKDASTIPELDTTLQVSLDMLQSYAADRQEMRSASQAGVTTANSSLVTIPVPSGEYWLLYGASATAINITAASSVKLVLSIQDPAAVENYIGGDQAPRVTAAGENCVLLTNLSGPILLKPGMRIGAGTLMAPTSLDLTLRAFLARFSNQ